jgi:hypothetical protein
MLQSTWGSAAKLMMISGCVLVIALVSAGRSLISPWINWYPGKVVRPAQVSGFAA